MANESRQKYLKTMLLALIKISRLVGHVPIELSFLFCKFIEKRNNQVFAEVNGGRKLENGLVAPCIYHVNGNKKHTETSEIRKRTFL